MSGSIVVATVFDGVIVVVSLGMFGSVVVDPVMTTVVTVVAAVAVIPIVAVAARVT